MILLIIVFCGKINHLWVSSLHFSYTVMTLENLPCHDQATTMALCEKVMELSFCETGPGEGVQFQQFVEDLVSFISLKLTPLDDIL
jgi:hypothetical protein